MLDLRGLEQMDEILVMDKGKIIDRGNFQQLAKGSDAFKTLHDLLFDVDQIQMK
ncbi:MAG: ABC transporter [Gammaproteobacteria bacterium]|nr:ABC transporter [Gammaproteobacteria bacterium]